ncbi:MAG: SDR family oxidoreductase [Bryobacterales bacterium]|nr:SDR family oxidoreductase [Bryobacterales bacterium]
MKTRAAIPGRFHNRTAIVTGGASGIGRAVVEELLQEGASVCFLDSSGTGAALASEWAGRGAGVMFCHGDVSDEAFCRASVDYAASRWGRVDYLVNNAFSFNAKGLDATHADWSRVMDVGPVAYARLAQLVVEPMKLAGGGAIVNVSSISAFIAQPNRWTYNAAKGAVHTLTKCMALDLAPYGIRVNSVSPGWIWTQEVDKAAAGDRRRWEPVWGQFHMLERCGDPVEVAGPILFLLSDDASFITAADLAVDGGYQGLGSEGIGKASKFAGSA